MPRLPSTAFMRELAVVLAGGLVLLGCGDDDSTSDVTGSADVEVVESEGSTEGDATGSESSDASSNDVDDVGLLVPLDYLQGEWCDHDGTTWTIEGEIAQLDDGSGGTGEMPVNVLFINVPGALVSQGDDQFVFMSAGEEVTFTRGAC